MIIYGIHTVTTVLKQSPQRIQKILICQQHPRQRLQTLLQAAEQINIKIEYISKQQLEQQCQSSHHQGVAAVCLAGENYQESDLDRLLDDSGKAALILILDQVTDPHNLGACLRCAAAANVDLLITPRDRAVGLNATVRKVACGAADIVPFMQVTNLARTLRKLQEKEIWLFGAVPEAEQSIYQTDFTTNIALVLGAESKGLRRLTREHCDTLITIPMSSTMASLNVSVAAGICLFEAVRQRTS